MAGPPENLTLRQRLDDKDTELERPDPISPFVEPRPMRLRPSAANDEESSPSQIPPPDPEPVFILDEFVKGIRASRRQSRAADFAREARKAELEGNMERKNSMLQAAIEAARQAEAVGPTVKSYKDIDDLDEAIRYGLGLTGQAALSVTASIVGGAAGRVITGIGRKVLTGRTLRNAPKLRNRIDDVGTFAGASYPMYGDIKGGAILDQEMDPIIAAQPVEDRERAATLTAIGSTALEAAVPAAIGARVGRRAMARTRYTAADISGRVSGKGRLVRDVLGEGMTELAQENLEQFSLHLQNPEQAAYASTEEGINAFFGGLAGGAFGHGIGRGMEGMTDLAARIRPAGPATFGMFGVVSLDPQAQQLATILKHKDTRAAMKVIDQINDGLQARGSFNPDPIESLNRSSKADNERKANDLMAELDEKATGANRQMVFAINEFFLGLTDTKRYQAGREALVAAHVAQGTDGKTADEKVQRIELRLTETQKDIRHSLFEDYEPESDPITQVQKTMAGLGRIDDSEGKPIPHELEILDHNDPTFNHDVNIDDWHFIGGSTEGGKKGERQTRMRAVYMDHSDRTQAEGKRTLKAIKQTRRKHTLKAIIRDSRNSDKAIKAAKKELRQIAKAEIGPRKNFEFIDLMIRMAESPFMARTKTAFEAPGASYIDTQGKRQTNEIQLDAQGNPLDFDAERAKISTYGTYLAAANAHIGNTEQFNLIETAQNMIGDLHERIEVNRQKKNKEFVIAQHEQQIEELMEGLRMEGESIKGEALPQGRDGNMSLKQLFDQKYVVGAIQRLEVFEKGEPGTRATKLDLEQMKRGTQDKNEADRKLMEQQRIGILQRVPWAERQLTKGSAFKIVWLDPKSIAIQAGKNWRLRQDRNEGKDRAPMIHQLISEGLSSVLNMPETMGFIHTDENNKPVEGDPDFNGIETRPGITDSQGVKEVLSQVGNVQLKAGQKGEGPEFGTLTITNKVPSRAISRKLGNLDGFYSGDLESANKYWRDKIKNIENLTQPEAALLLRKLYLDDIMESSKSSGLPEIRAYWENAEDADSVGKINALHQTDDALEQGDTQPGDQEVKQLFHYMKLLTQRLNAELDTYLDQTEGSPASLIELLEAVDSARDIRVKSLKQQLKETFTALDAANKIEPRTPELQARNAQRVQELTAQSKTIGSELLQSNPAEGTKFDMPFLATMLQLADLQLSLQSRILRMSSQLKGGTIPGTQSQVYPKLKGIDRDILALRHRQLKGFAKTVKDVVDGIDARLDAMAQEQRQYVDKLDESGGSNVEAQFGLVSINKETGDVVFRDIGKPITDDGLSRSDGTLLKLRQTQLKKTETWLKNPEVQTTSPVATVAAAQQRQRFEDRVLDLKADIKSLTAQAARPVTTSQPAYLSENTIINEQGQIEPILPNHPKLPAPAHAHIKSMFKTIENAIRLMAGLDANQFFKKASQTERLMAKRAFAFVTDRKGIAGLNVGNIANVQADQAIYMLLDGKGFTAKKDNLPGRGGKFIKLAMANQAMIILGSQSKINKSEFETWMKDKGYAQHPGNPEIYITTNPLSIRRDNAAWIATVKAWDKGRREMLDGLQNKKTFEADMYFIKQLLWRLNMWYTGPVRVNKSGAQPFGASKKERQQLKELSFGAYELDRHNGKVVLKPVPQKEREEIEAEREAHFAEQEEAEAKRLRNDPTARAKHQRQAKARREERAAEYQESIHNKFNSIQQDLETAIELVSDWGSKDARNTLADWFNNRGESQAERRLLSDMHTSLWRNKRVRARLAYKLQDKNIRKRYDISKKDLRRAAIDQGFYYALAFQFATDPQIGLKLSPASEQIFRRIITKLMELVGIHMSYWFGEAIFTQIKLKNLTNQEQIVRFYRDKQDKPDAVLQDITVELRRVINRTITAGNDVLRNLNSPMAKRLADLFDIPEADPRRIKTNGFLPRRREQNDYWLNQANIHLERAFSDKDLADGWAEYRLGDPKSKAAKAIEKYVNRIYRYMERKGARLSTFENGRFSNQLPTERTWRVPMAFNVQAVADDRLGLQKLFVTHGLDLQHANDLVDSILWANGHYSLVDNQYDQDANPVSSTSLSGLLQIINKDNAKEFEKFMANDGFAAILKFTRQAVHKAEFSDSFGHNGAIITQTLNDLRARGLAKAELNYIENRVIPAMLGTLAYKMHPKWRTAIGTVITIQNMAILPLMIFPAMVDIWGISMTTGEMKHGWRAFRSGMREIKQSLPGWRPDGLTADQQLAELLGIITDHSLLDRVGDTYNEMMDQSILRKANQKFFMLTGVEQWTKGVRIAAMHAGISYIKDHRNDPDKLGALGLKKSDVKIDSEGNLVGLTTSIKMGSAINRFVDSTVLRPSAAHRPAWGSDPRWLFIWHLKQFTFTFHKVFLGKVINELHKSNPDYMILLPFLMMIPTMMASDAVKNILAPSVFYEQMSFTEAVQHAVARSSVLGIGTFGLDAARDIDFGKLPGSSLLGPTADSVYRFYDKGFAQGIYRLTPGYALANKWL